MCHFVKCTSPWQVFLLFFFLKKRVCLDSMLPRAFALPVLGSPKCCLSRAIRFFLEFSSTVHPFLSLNTEWSFAKKRNPGSTNAELTQKQKPLLLERPWENVSLPRATAWADSETQGCVVQGPDTKGSQNPRVFNPSPESHHNYFFTQGGGAGRGEEKGEAGQETSLSAAALKRRWKCEVKGWPQARHVRGEMRLSEAQSADGGEPPWPQSDPQISPVPATGTRRVSFVR